MIIYKNTIDGFINDCYNNDIVEKIKISLRFKRGINVSKKEKISWSTLKTVSEHLKNINNKENQYVLLEFVIRDSRQRIDLIIIGKDHKDRKNVAIIELKGWSEITLVENSLLLNPNFSYGLCNHPSYEAYDYYWQLKNMYSELKDFNMFPFSFLPNYEYKTENVLIAKRFKDIIDKSKAYCKSNQDDLHNTLNKYFQERIDEKEVDRFDDITYKPSKTFMEHMKEECKNIRLIGSQNVAYETFLYQFKRMENNIKKLFIISGGAGSGKTIVAFKIMAYLRSIGTKANLILPGPEFRDAIVKTYGKTIASEFIKGADYKLESDYSIVDEAHKATGRDNAHIFYSRFIKNIKKGLITLIDDNQVVNKKGISKDELKDIAVQNNFQIVELNLTEQFRNGGDCTYPDWLKHKIFKDEEVSDQEQFVNHFYQFKIFDEKEFNEMYKSYYEKYNVRLLSFWTQTWDLNGLNPTVKIGNSKYIWNPNWQWLMKYRDNGNKVTKDLIEICEKKNFNLDKKGYQYIGYFNTTQGYEFEYIFVHVPKVFYLNNKGEVDVNLDELCMNEMSSQIWSTKNIKDEDEKQKKVNLNKKYFLNRLFINLTRGTKGTFVYIEDEKLRDYFERDVIIKKA